MISDSIQQQVMDILQQGLDKIQAHYGRKFPMPSVDYKVTGATAGYARHSQYRISLNGELMLLHLDAFLARTVLHELAHLVTERIYPHQPDLPIQQVRVTVWQKAGKVESKTNRPAKRESHGPRWQEVMAVLGVEASRCHSYDVSTTVKPKTKYEYGCPCCNSTFIYGPKIHQVQQQKPKYVCPKCHIKGVRSSEHYLVLIKSLGRVTYSKGREVVDGVANAGPEAKYQLKLQEPKPNTKMAACWNMYQAYVGRYDRNGLISVFVNECGCTPAGAATYYANCKKLYQAGV